MDGLSSSTHIPAGRFYWKSNPVGDFLKTLFCAHLAPGRGGAAIIQAYFPTPPSIYCGALRDIAIFVAALPLGGRSLTARDRAIYPGSPRRGTPRPVHSYHSMQYCNAAISKRAAHAANRRSPCHQERFRCALRLSDGS